jgi:hypothetical protein
MNLMEKANRKGDAQFRIETLTYDDGLWWVQNFAIDPDPGCRYFWEALKFQSWVNVLK